VRLLHSSGFSIIGCAWKFSNHELKSSLEELSAMFLSTARIRSSSLNITRSLSDVLDPRGTTPCSLNSVESSSALSAGRPCRPTDPPTTCGDAFALTWN
jgi:hypothetical protein